jgi:hypothetical protein
MKAKVFFLNSFVKPIELRPRNGFSKLLPYVLHAYRFILFLHKGIGNKYEKRVMHAH